MKERKELDWLDEPFAEDASKANASQTNKRATIGKKDFDWIDDPFIDQGVDKSGKDKQGMTRGSKLLIGGVLCVAFILFLVFVILIGYSLLSGNTSSDPIL